MTDTAVLERRVRGMICIACEAKPQVVWLGSLTGAQEHGIKCACWPHRPSMAKVRRGSRSFSTRYGEVTFFNASYPCPQCEGTTRILCDQHILCWGCCEQIHEEVKNMTTETGLVRFQTMGGTEVRLSLELILEYLAPRGVKVEEAMIFLETCQASGFNPWLRDAWLTKPDPNGPAAIMVAIQAYEKRAELAGTYGGQEYGLDVIRDGKPVRIGYGEQAAPEDTLYGAWSNTFRTDRSLAERVSVKLANFIKKTREGKVTRFWASMPEYMIVKVARAQGFKRAFPNQSWDQESRIAVQVEAGDSAPAIVAAPPENTNPPPISDGVPQEKAGVSVDQPEAPSAAESAEAAEDVDVFFGGSEDPRATVVAKNATTASTKSPEPAQEQPRATSEPREEAPAVESAKPSSEAPESGMWSGEINEAGDPVVANNGQLMDWARQGPGKEAHEVLSSLGIKQLKNIIDPQLAAGKLVKLWGWTP